jgi:8-oxo-dGTP pyrophosphatase MutT (NUDIX family)
VARVILLDPDDRLLLLYDPDPERGAYWYPPGGRIERSEQAEDAARRELSEELGLTNVALGPVVLRRRARFTYGDRLIDQDEWHFVARVSGPFEPITRRGDNEADAVAAHRWWSAEEIRTSGDRFFPEGLADIVTPLLNQARGA